jgi:hypothetical protein
LALTALGVWFAGWGIRRSNKNSSAATLVALNEGLRQGWDRFLHDDPGKQDHHFADLLNIFEIACSLWCKRVFIGASREILRDYLDQAFALFKEDEYAISQLRELITHRTTFKYIRKYLQKRRLFD